MNKNEDILFAAFTCNLVRLKELAAEKDFTPFVLGRFNLKDFPVYYLNMCLRQIFVNPDQWSEGCQDFVRMIERRNNEVLEWWRDEMGVDVNKRIPFNHYCDFFYCADPELESDEDFFGEGDIDEFAAKNNVRRIDIELFCAAAKMEFERVERLLEVGANPRAYLHWEDYPVGECLVRISTEWAFMDVEWNGPYRDIIEGRRTELDKYDIYNCIGYAAHKSMYDLLTSKDEDEPEQIFNKIKQQ